MLTIRKTERGFKIAEFIDLYGKPCSIQESSLATDNAIWLGVAGTGERMHLNQDQVKDLLPLLKYFVKHGELP